MGLVRLDASYALYPEEQNAVAKAVPKRRIEFASGRKAARVALQYLGCTAGPIPSATDRQPVWPEGVVGSISHANGFAAALVGRACNVAGLGIDIEGKAPLKDEILSYVLTPTERARAAKQPRLGGITVCKATFVAKEAIFKAIYPITNRFFGFQDAEVSLSADGHWIASLAPGVLPEADACSLQTGRFVVLDDLVVASVAVTRDR